MAVVVDFVAAAAVVVVAAAAVAVVVASVVVVLQPFASRQPFECTPQTVPVR